MLYILSGKRWTSMPEPDDVRSDIAILLLLQLVVHGRRLYAAPRWSRQCNEDSRRRAVWRLWSLSGRSYDVYRSIASVPIVAIDSMDESKRLVPTTTAAPTL